MGLAFMLRLHTAKLSKDVTMELLRYLHFNSQQIQRRRHILLLAVLTFLALC